MSRVPDYIKSLSVSLLLSSCEEVPPESLPVSDTSSLKSDHDMPANELFISKDTVEHTSNCESADVTENTLLFESQSINTFSGIYISQSVDWERPFLSPHFLLIVTNKWNGIRYIHQTHVSSGAF